MKNRLSFDQQIEVADQCLRELAEHSGKAPPSALEALAASLAELRRAGGELEAGRQAAQAALEAERALAAAVLDMAAALVIVLDREGRILRFNRACEQATGYTADEVAGRRFWDFPLLPEEAAPARAAFDALRDGHFPNQFENTWVARDGSRRLIAWTNTAILGPDGAVETIVGTGLDITARWRAEAQKEAALATLRESEARVRFLADLVERASQPIGSGYPDGRVAFVNAAYGDLVGYSPEEMQALDWAVDLTPPEWRALEAERLAELHHTGQPVRYEKEYVRKDGTRVPVELLVHLVRDEAGALQYYYSFVTDITERKRAESQREAALQALRESEEKFKKLFDVLPIGISILDAERHVVDANPALEAILSLSRADLLAGTYTGRKNFRPDGTPMAAEELASTRAFKEQQIVRDVEIGVQKENGTFIWTSISAAPFDLPGLSLAIITQDITAQVQAKSQREAALAERERLLAEVQAKNEELQSQAEELRAQTLDLEAERARLRAIIDSAPEAILVADERGDVVLANPAAAHLFAAPVHGASGLEYYGQVARYRPDHTSYQPHERPCFRAAVHRETQRDLPIALLWPDGQWRDVQVNAAPILDSHGQGHGAVAVYQDITERKQAEAQREAALAALQAALAEKEVLMREIYHRVKNNVQALIYLIEMQAEESPDEASRQLLHELQERARTLALVHEKLYQSQNLAQIDFGDYLYDLVDNLSRAFGTGRPIVWRIDAAGLPLGVDTAIPCGLIVSELLTNALKYAFPAGAPCAEQGTDCIISVESRVDGDQITLIVSDNGVGLPPGVDWSTTRTLGLQLVNILARHQLGGQVEVDRRAGTTFKITFTDRERKRP